MSLVQQRAKSRPAKTKPPFLCVVLERLGFCTQKPALEYADDQAQDKNNHQVRPRTPSWSPTTRSLRQAHASNGAIGNCNGIQRQFEEQYCLPAASLALCQP